MAQSANDPLGAFLRAPASLATPGDASPVDLILEAVRNHLGMEIAFASRIANGKRQFTHISADIPLPVSPGDAEPLEETLCHLILKGQLPQLMHDAAEYDLALTVPITLALPIGSHLNVPLRLSTGELYGTFCCVSRTADRSLNDRDIATLRAFADLAVRQIERDQNEDGRLRERSVRIGAMLESQALTIVHQPIHRLGDGRPVGVECLARFPDCAVRGPDAWFAEASEAGLGIELEMLAVRNALATMRHVPAGHYASINVSPDTVISGALHDVLDGSCSERLVIEVTEHDRVSDYAALRDALRPLRAKARIAIDDVGAGYAGLRHLVDLQPDILKLDMSLTRDIADDAARRALAHALVRFASEIGCSIVAEGIETEAERRTLDALQVPFAQGYLFSRPMPVVAAQQFLLGAAARVETREAASVDRMARRA